MRGHILGRLMPHIKEKDATVFGADQSSSDVTKSQTLKRSFTHLMIGSTQRCCYLSFRSEQSQVRSTDAHWKIYLGFTITGNDCPEVIDNCDFN